MEDTRDGITSETEFEGQNGILMGIDETTMSKWGINQRKLPKNTFILTIIFVRECPQLDGYSGLSLDRDENNENKSNLKRTEIPAILKFQTIGRNPGNFVKSHAIFCVYIWPCSLYKGTSFYST